MFGALPLGEWLHLERWEVRAACSLSIQRIIHGICSGARCRAETGRRSSPSRRRGSKSCGAQSDEPCTFRMQRWSSNTLDGPEIFAKSGSSLGGDEGSLHALLARGLVSGKVTGVAGAGGSRSNRRSAPAHSFLLASRLSPLASRTFGGRMTGAVLTLVWIDVGDACRFHRRVSISHSIKLGLDMRAWSWRLGLAARQFFRHPWRLEHGGRGM